MTDGLRCGRYRFVVLECHPAEIDRAGSTLERCLAPFVRAGYRGWHIDHSPAMHRRAAAGPVPIGDLLAPIDPDADLDALGADPWLHLLWAAQGETPLA
jgi:hypothetical protein